MLGLSCTGQKGRRKKVYLLLFTCSLSRAIHLEVLPSWTSQEFSHALKRLIARGGRPKVIYSYNSEIFFAESKWIKRIIKDELIQEHLTKEELQWIFNLSRAPWWDGEFEQIIALLSLFVQNRRKNLRKFEGIWRDLKKLFWIKKLHWATTLLCMWKRVF